MEKEEKSKVRQQDNNLADVAKKIECMNHGKESTKNSYLLHLQARIVEFRMASDMEM